MKNNKVVYIHRKKTDSTIFYVGIGKPSRAYSKSPTSRSVVWSRTVKKHGYYVEVILEDLEWEEACEIEIYLIEKFGRRDLKKGALVNLTDGGEGATNMSEEGRRKISEATAKAVYNIDTGEMFKTMGDAATYYGLRPTTLTTHLGSYNRNKGRRSSIPDSTKLRLMTDPYPEHTSFWNEVRDNEISIESDEFKDMNDDFYYNEHDGFDDEETEIIERIYNEPEDNIDMIYLSYNKSIRGVAKEMNINYGMVYKRLNESKERVLRERIGEYKNSKNKRL